MSKKSDNGKVIVAVISAITLIVTAIITGFFNITTTRIPIEATQTAETNLNTSYFTATPRSIASTPTITPTVIPATSKSANPTITWDANRFIMAFSAAIVLLGVVWLIIGLPHRLALVSVAISAHYTEFKIGISALMNSLGLMLPVALIWSKFFLGWPQSDSLALVLFVNVLFVALLLWFQESLSNLEAKMWLIIVASILLLYVVSFSLTHWNPIEAFKNASIILMGSISYLLLMALLPDWTIFTIKKHH